MNGADGGGAAGADESPAPNSSIRVTTRRSPRERFIERSACPACGALASDTLLTLSYADAGLTAFMQKSYERAKDLPEWLEGGVYQLDRCGECRLVFQRSVAGRDLGAVLEDAWLEATEDPDTAAQRAQLAAPRTSRDGHELFAAASALGKPVTDLRVLDYGMGWGLWARTAKQLGAQCFGHDPSEARCEHARQHGIQVSTLFDLDRVQADFINGDQILARTNDPLEALSDMVRALAPKGIVKLCVPRAADIERRIRVLDWSAPKDARNSLYAVQPLAQVNCFGWPALEALAARAGLRRIRVPWSARGAFLRVPGAVLWKQPRTVVKALARPVWRPLTRSKLYGWFVRAGA
jgi:2-polyprenyl-3-methyl-5-hydroxy-6-metoxy-1,4-benzoquinol methylase